MSHHSHPGGGIIAFLCGAAVGAAVGILLAPDKGVKTRKKIMRKGHELSDNVEDKFKEMKEYITDLLDDIRNAEEELINRAEEE